jgi:hypothetical protein
MQAISSRLAFGWCLQKILRGQQHARSAEAALQRVSPMKGRLYFP